MYNSTIRRVKKPCKCGCNQLGYIYAKGMIKEHYLRKFPPNKIKTNSYSRAIHLEFYYTVSRPNYLADHKECELYKKIMEFKSSGGEAQWWPVCSKDAVEIHHKEGRVGELLNDVTKFIAACQSQYRPRSCHAWVTRHSNQAIQIGVSLKRNT